MATRQFRAALIAAILSLGGSALAAHDLFLKLTSYFLPASSSVRALLLNGTFTRSENSITRDRLADLSLVGPQGKMPLDSAALTPLRDSTYLRFRTSGEGTYVVGVSIRPREIALTGKAFNAYLKEEGLDETLAERARTGTLEARTNERYAKHVKAVFQVGEGRSDQYGEVLGYPAEIVPLVNPYSLGVGDSITVRCFVGGRPAPGLTVLAGGTTSRGNPIRRARARTDSAGIASVRLGETGRWYLKFISMRESATAGLTHESQWATLTFQVR